MEFVDYIFYQEKERAKPHYGKNIRSKKHEKALWDGKSGRNRIYGKNNVCALHQENNHEQNSGMPLPFFLDKEPAMMLGVGKWQISFCEF